MKFIDHFNIFFFQNIRDDKVFLIEINLKLIHQHVYLECRCRCAYIYLFLLFDISLDKVIYNCECEKDKRMIL